MKAKDLIKMYSMKDHEENGMFIELNEEKDTGEYRPTSGCIYYYVAEKERTKFHKIDCDEYWVYNAGSDIEICIICENGEVEFKKLGLGENKNLSVLIKKGSIFASKVLGVDDGTLITCITIPRFRYSGFKLYEDSEAINIGGNNVREWIIEGTD